MKSEIIYRMEMLQAVGVFAAKNSVAAPGSRLARLFAEAATIQEELRIAAAKQHGEHSEFRAAAAERFHFATSLREWMGEIAMLARSLPTEEVGALREYFRMPRSQSYVALRNCAAVFIKHLAEVKDVFLDCGFEENFVERAQALMAQMDEAGRSKINSYSSRVAETARLMQRSSQGLAIVRQIHAILCYKLKSYPPLLAAWESARRVHRRRGGASGGEDEAVANGETAGVPVSAPFPSEEPVQVVATAGTQAGCGILSGPETRHSLAEKPDSRERLAT